jgi:hypothetical protein
MDPNIKSYFQNHITDWVQILANVGIISWALIKKADNFLIGYINGEVAKKFFTKEDGVRVEHKLDTLIDELNAKKKKKET